MVPKLSEREIDSEAELLIWLADYSELDAAFDEEMAWRYIRSTCDTVNADFAQAYEFLYAKLNQKQHLGFSN